MKGLLTMIKDTLNETINYKIKASLDPQIKPGSYIQILGYNFDEPNQYFEVRHNEDGSLIKLGGRSRYRYSQDIIISLSKSCDPVEISRQQFH